MPVPSESPYATREPLAVPVAVVPLPFEDSVADGLVVPLPVQAVAAPRFCRKCGSPWDEQWTACEPCERKVQRAAVLLEHAPESRAVKSAVALYFTLLAVCAISIALGQTGAGRGDDGLGIELGCTIGLSLVTVAWAIVTWRRVLPALTAMARPQWFAVAIGLSLITYAIATGTINGFLHLVHQQSADQMSDPFLKAGYGWGFAVLCVCVQPAVIEELAFRGVIFAGVGRVLNPVETVLVTALMFMILHLSPVRFPHTFALGLSAGFLRMRTKSLYPCMALHFAHNLLCVGGERFGWF